MLETPCFSRTDFAPQAAMARFEQTLPFGFTSITQFWNLLVDCQAQSRSYDIPYDLLLQKL